MGHGWLSGGATWRAGVGPPTTSDDRGRGPRLVASAPFVASVAVLLLNDHVLKQAWPGWVTGKLSDVAGVAMAAIGLTALLRVQAVAFAVTAVAFGLLKSVPAVAVWAAAVLGGRTLTDSSDLLALLVLVPLWGWVSSRRSVAVSVPSPSIAPRRSILIVPLQIAAIVFAVVATTGSDCAPDGLFDVSAIDGVLYARADLDVWTSADGGATWQSSDIDGLDPRFDARQDPPTCVGERCFDIVTSDGDGTISDGSVAIVESGGEESVAVLTVTGADRRTFANTLEPSCGGSSVGGVAAVEVGADLHLVVEMGEAGVLHRGPDEEWEWVVVGPWGLDGDDVPAESFLGHEIVSRPDRPLFASAWLARVLLLGVPIATFAAAAPLGALAVRRGRSAIAAVSLAFLLGLGLLAPALLFLRFLSEESPAHTGGYVVAGGVLMLIAAVGIGLLSVWFGRSARPIPHEPAWPRAVRDPGTSSR